MNRILVVNVNWLGDVVFSIPVFKALKTQYPQSQISCLAPQRVKEVLEMCPFVDQVLVFDEKGRHRSLFGKLNLIGELRQNEFDVVFLLHRSLTRALLTFLAGIPVRVGYDTKNRGFLLTHRFPVADAKLHRSEQYFQLVESYGINVKDRTCDLVIPDSLIDWANRFLTEQGVGPKDFLVMVNCGGNWDLKRWPKENFSELINRLTKEFGAKVIIPGATRDLPLVQEIAGLSGSHPIVLAGKTGIKELLALMKRVSLVVSSDSGPLHLAASVATPVLGLFGPTRPEITGPRGAGRASILQNDVDCNRAPCYYLDCPENVCMKSISVNDVINEIRKIKNS